MQSMQSDSGGAWPVSLESHIATPALLVLLREPCEIAVLEARPVSQTGWAMADAFSYRRSPGHPVTVNSFSWDVFGAGSSGWWFCFLQFREDGDHNQPTFYTIIQFWDGSLNHQPVLGRVPNANYGGFTSGSPMWLQKRPSWTIPEGFARLWGNDFIGTRKWQMQLFPHIGRLKLHLFFPESHEWSNRAPCVSLSTREARVQIQTLLAPCCVREIGRQFLFFFFESILARKIEPSLPISFRVLFDADDPAGYLNDWFPL